MRKISLKRFQIEAIIKQAIRQKQVDELIKLCETNRNDMIAFTYKGKRMIHFAIELNSTNLLQKLLYIGADWKVFSEEYSGSFSILHIACKKGNIDMVKFILKHVPDVSFWKSLSKRSYPTPKSYIYQNSFYYAAKSGIEEVVKALQDHGNLNINEHIPGSPSAIKTLIYEQDRLALKFFASAGQRSNL